jgi:hypothetical protein
VEWRREMGTKNAADTRIPQKLGSRPKGDANPLRSRIRVVLPPAIMAQNAP